ncbi:MAG: hypothetical protein ACTSPY_17485 [Candidatus Helarchaeota archaeon]
MLDEHQIPDMLYIERSVFEQFIDYTFRNSKYEWGGILIGQIFNDKRICLAAILPPQKTQNMGYCEFRKELFHVLYNIFEELNEIFDENEEYIIISWIHTHPNLDVFLSSTDQNTFFTLSKFNPELTAIVVDPVQYKWLAVNSRPGNSYGFTQIKLDLNYLYNFDHPNQNIIQRLNKLKELINTEKYRKLAKLSDSEKIEVYIPIQFDHLSHNLILSNLETLNNQICNTKKFLFPKLSLIETSTNIQNISSNNLEDLEINYNVNHPEPIIKNLVDYLSILRNIELEIRSWKYFTPNRLLYNYDLESFFQYYDGLTFENNQKIINKVIKIAKITLSIPVIKLSVYDNGLEFSDIKNIYVKNWNSIKRVEIDDFFKKLNPQLYVLSLKGGFFSKKMDLIFFNPNINEFLSLIKNKIMIVKCVNFKVRIKYVNFINKLKKKKENKLAKNNKTEQINTTRGA